MRFIANRQVLWKGKTYERGEPVPDFDAHRVDVIGGGIIVPEKDFRGEVKGGPEKKAGVIREGTGEGGKKGK